eukprot:Colp12_sorted_trinity150504_noHs@35018
MRSRKKAAPEQAKAYDPKADKDSDLFKGKNIYLNEPSVQNHGSPAKFSRHPSLNAIARARHEEIIKGKQQKEEVSVETKKVKKDKKKKVKRKSSTSESVTEETQEQIEEERKQNHADVQTDGHLDVAVQTDESCAGLGAFDWGKNPYATAVVDEGYSYDDDLPRARYGRTATWVRQHAWDQPPTHVVQQNHPIDEEDEMERALSAALLQKLLTGTPLQSALQNATSAAVYEGVGRE